MKVSCDFIEVKKNIQSLLVDSNNRRLKTLYLYYLALMYASLVGWIFD